MTNIKVSPQIEVVFSGFGGQGVMFVGQLLAYAGMDAGKEVTWIPSYGPEMRGGTAHCFVVIKDTSIGAPVVKHPQNAVVFNLPSFDKYEPMVAEDGLLVVNSSLISKRSQRTDLNTLYIPATEIAESIGSARMANLVLLGALLQARDIIPLAVLRQALSDHIPAHRRNMLEMNYEAFARGADFATTERVW
jgi:2-oxoglutarate ferredoxin oxidoreductase subunit gamma